MSASAKQNHNGKAPQQGQDHNGLKRERITDIQRARTLNAMAEVACEHGAANATVAHIVHRAGVSRRTFYELFEDREDCFLATLEEAVREASVHVRAAYDPRAKWADRIRQSLIALLQLLDERPSMGRVLIVESLAAGPKALRRRQQALEFAIAAVDEGRKQGTTTALGDSTVMAETVVGGVLSVLHARLSRPQTGRLAELTSSLMGMMVLPYLGPAAARREFARPQPTTKPQIPVAAGNPLKQLHMRLTYRTLRVLSALAAHPGSSNRRIAETAGITDQGQMSKLLARLQQLGLIENANAPAATRGEPNAWTLTAKGWEMHGALTKQVTRSTTRG